MPTKHLLIPVIALGLGAAVMAHARTDVPETFKRNWTQWRGPFATGEAPMGKPPVTWSESQNIKWKVKLPGGGSSTPIVWEDRIFVTTAIGTGKKVEAAETPAPAEGEPGRRGGRGMRSQKPTEVHQFVLLCLDRASGKVRWQKVAREEVPHEGHHQDHGFASYSPITDGNLVFAYFGSRGLFCYDMEGNLKWSKDLGRMRTRNGFGEGGAPALHGGTIVVNWDHEGEDFIAAFDKETGREIWRQDRDEITSWSTPLIVSHGSGAQVITAATRKVRSYDLATGKIVWEGPGLTDNVIPSPVMADGVVYVMSGFRGAALYAIRLGKTGDIAGTDGIVWQHGKSTPYVPSPLLHGDRLYFFAGNNGMLSCFDVKTGQPHYEAERIDGLFGVYASPVAAGGNIYLVGRNGATVVVKDAPKLEVVATNKLDDRIDASPAVAGRELFLRGHEHLYCIAE